MYVCMYVCIDNQLTPPPNKAQLTAEAFPPLRRDDLLNSKNYPERLRNTHIMLKLNQPDPIKTQPPPAQQNP